MHSACPWQRLHLLRASQHPGHGAEPVTPADQDNLCAARSVEAWAWQRQLNSMHSVCTEQVLSSWLGASSPAASRSACRQPCPHKLTYQQALHGPMHCHLHRINPSFSLTAATGRSPLHKTALIKAQKKVLQLCSQAPCDTCVILCRGRSRLWQTQDIGKSPCWGRT